MTKLKRCPCCHSDKVGPNYSFMTEDEYSAITIRCRDCGLMLTPVEHPTNDDGDLWPEDSDEVEEVLDDLAYDWNRRTKDNSVADVIEFSRTILREIDRYANKVNGIEQINRVEKLRRRLKELEEIHCLEVKGDLVQAKHDTGSQVPNRQPYVAGFDPAHPQDVRLTMPNLSEIGVIGGISGISASPSQGEDGMTTSAGGESVQSNGSGQQPRLDAGDQASRSFEAYLSRAYEGPVNDGVRGSTRNSTDPGTAGHAADRISAPAGETDGQPCGSVAHNGSPDGAPAPAEL